MPRAHPLSVPPLSGKGKLYEQKATQIRLFAGLSELEPLDPFRLAEALNLQVISVGAVEGLSDWVRESLGKPDRQWSGATMPPLADGRQIIILNDRQSRTRQAATLMEEICHVLLGHKHTRVAVTPGVLGHQGRVYDEVIEQEAYGVGAAVLVPYRALVRLLQAQQSIKQIAQHFGVSQALIRYRMKLLGLGA